MRDNISWFPCLRQYGKLTPTCQCVATSSLCHSEALPWMFQERHIRLSFVLRKLPEKPDVVTGNTYWTVFALHSPCLRPFGRRHSRGGKTHE